MSAAPIPVPLAELEPEKGYLELWRGIDKRGMPTFDWRQLVRRAGPLGFVLMCYILDRTLSAWGSPSAARIKPEEFQKLTGKTAHTIRREMARLESAGLISRDEEDPWCFTPHPEAFGTAPLLMPPRRPVQRERHAAAPAPSQQAAFRGNIASEPPPSPAVDISVHRGENTHAAANVPLDEIVRVDKNVHASDPAAFVILGQPVDKNVHATDTNDRPAATYCPWNWPCPFIPSDLPADKPYKPYKPEDEAAVSQSVAFCASAESADCLPPAPCVEVIPAQTQPLPDPCRWCGTRHEVADVVAVVQRVALPVIGSQPTVAQYHEIHRRLDGACVLQFDAALEAKKRSGKLNSVFVLPFIAGDCAVSKHAWKPPGPAKPPGKKSFADTVLDDCAEEIQKYGRIL